MDALPRTTPLRHMLWLAWLLSAVYLGAGAFVAAVNRFTHGTWGRLAMAMDMFAASFLRLAHLWIPLLEAMGHGQLRVWQMRLILIALSVGLIFAYALVVGVFLQAARALWARLG